MNIRCSRIPQSAIIALCVAFVLLACGNGHDPTNFKFDDISEFEAPSGESGTVTVPLNSTQTITMDPRTAWAEVSDLERFSDHIKPFLKSCTVQGSGVGATLNMQYASGDEVVQELIHIVPPRMIVSWQMSSTTLPMEAFTETIRIRQTEDGHSVFYWSSECRTDAGNASTLYEWMRDRQATFYASLLAM